MRALRRLTPVALLAATFALGACGDDPLSPDTVDPVAMSGALGDAAATLQNNVAFQSLSALSYRFPVFLQAGGQAATIRSSIAALGAGAGGLAASAARVNALRASAGNDATFDILALFPPDVLGKTLEWDEATDQYVIGVRTGAPANGLRILLYAIDPNTGMPIEPVQELGSIELTDESSPQADKLGLVLRLGNTVIADYDVTAVFGLSISTRTAVGFVRRADGTHQLNFNLSESFTPATSTGAINYQFDGPDGIELDIAATGTPTQATYTLRIAGPGNTITVNATENATGLTGEIRFNGTLVATVTGTSNDPIITSANNREISPAHLQALLAILDHVGNFIDEFTTAIFRPSETVF